MKKVVILLLCLVLLVPFTALSVSAKSVTENYVTSNLTTTHLLSNREGFLKQFLSKFGNMKVGSDESKEPDNNSTGKDVLHAYEEEVVSLVNQERARYGLAPLTIHRELCEGARMKSRDMQQNGYFSHTSPTYGTPFQMMKKLGISYRTAGENIAKGFSSPQAVVNAWMNSEGHRANILNGSYTEIGVGYVADGGYYTQWFRG